MQRSVLRVVASRPSFITARFKSENPLPVSEKVKVIELDESVDIGVNQLDVTHQALNVEVKGVMSANDVQQLLKQDENATIYVKPIYPQKSNYQIVIETLALLQGSMTKLQESMTKLHMGQAVSILSQYMDDLEKQVILLQFGNLLETVEKMRPDPFSPPLKALRERLYLMRKIAESDKAALAKGDELVEKLYDRIKKVVDMLPNDFDSATRQLSNVRNKAAHFKADDAMLEWAFKRLSTPSDEFLDPPKLNIPDVELSGISNTLKSGANSLRELIGQKPLK